MTVIYLTISPERRRIVYTPVDQTKIVETGVLMSIIFITLTYTVHSIYFESNIKVTKLFKKGSECVFHNSSFNAISANGLRCTWYKCSIKNKVCIPESGIDIYLIGVLIFRRILCIECIHVIHAFICLINTSRRKVFTLYSVIIHGILNNFCVVAKFS